VRKLKEEDLREPVRAFFRGQGYAVFDEAKLFARGIDVVAKQGGVVVSVELKLRNWRRAVAQTYLDLRVSDYAFVAMPRNAIENNDELRRECARLGVGLLTVDGDKVKLVLQPVISGRIQTLLRQRFLAKLKV
jgi:hypothetical protein